MKVALVIERMDTRRGGRETSTAQMAAGLARRGCEVTILCQSGSSPDAGVEVRPLGARGRGRTRRLKNFAADVEREVRGRGFDIVHATLPIPCCNVYQPRGGTVPGQFEASLRRRSFLGRILRRVSEPANRYRRLMSVFETELLTGGRAVCLCVSEMVKDECRRCYGRHDGVEVVYNCVDVPEADSPKRGDDRRRVRDQIDAGPNDPVFLTVATNFRLKGVAEAIRAFAAWRTMVTDIRPRLVVVGRTRPVRYRRLAARRGVGDSVTFVPPTSDVFQWYAAADAVILLSWYDPCSRVVLEAARWGIPSITTRYNGAAEAFDEGGCIVVDSPRATSAIMEACAQLADPQRRRGHSLACGRLADYLGVDRHVEQLLDVYTRAAELV